MMYWQSEKGADFFVKVILFIISPFISFIYALYRIKTKSSFIIIYLFSLFYGMSYITESGKSETAKNDGAVYRAIFENDICGMNFQEFKRDIIEILTGQSWYKDIYFHCVAYPVSKFTDNYHFLFLAFAVIFGYFMLKSLHFLVRENKYDNRLVSLLLLSLFVTNGIFNINGMRFWTATWIATYALLNILVDKKRSYLLLLLITPLIHSSFYFLLIIYLIYIFTNKRFIWRNFYFASFFFSSISVFVISAFIGDIPLFHRFLIYLDPEAAFSVLAGKSLLKGIFDLLSTIYINIMFYLIYKQSERDHNSIQSKSLFNFFFVYISIINFVRPVPSLGTRFFVVGFPLIAYLWLVTFGTNRYKWVIYSMPLFMLWHLHNSYQLFTYFLEPSFYVSSPFSIIARYL